MQIVPVPDFSPLKGSYTDLDIERILIAAYLGMIDAYLRPQERTLALYGIPVRSEIETFERFVKSNGLALYRADVPNIEPYIRYLYRVVTGLRPTGEIGLLDIFLQALFPSQYSIVRLWHRIGIPYPSGIIEYEIPNETFLTSRINVYIDPDALNTPFAGRILAAVQAVVGFEIFLKVYVQGKSVPEVLGFIPIISPFMVVGIEDQDTIDQLGSFTT